MRLSPTYPVGWDQLGLSYAQAKLPDKAVDAYSRAAAALPAMAARYDVNAGIELAQAGRPKEALQVFERSRPLFEKSLDAEGFAGLYYLGSLYFDARQDAKARDALQSFLSKQPLAMDATTTKLREDAQRKLKMLGA